MWIAQNKITYTFDKLSLPTVQVFLGSPSLFFQSIKLYLPTVSLQALHPPPIRSNLLNSTLPYPTTLCPQMFNHLSPFTLLLYSLVHHHFLVYPALQYLICFVCLLYVFLFYPVPDQNVQKHALSSGIYF